MSPQALAALEKTSEFLSIGQYSPLTIRNYLSELRYLFVYQGDVSPGDFTEDMILQYLLYLAKTLDAAGQNVGWLPKAYLFTSGMCSDGLT